APEPLPQGQPGIFNSNSHNCMSVKLSAKCVSRTAVLMCGSAQGKLLAQGAHPNGAIACYSELATVMNDFLDIMNGAMLERKEDIIVT
ncbi:unnamed protein product, partial [Pylaiella littoralis]